MSDVTDALVAALDRVDFVALTRHMMDVAPPPEQAPTMDDAAVDQFVRAFQTVMREALEGGREQRDLVMEASIPALVARGDTPSDLVQSHVGFFVVITPRLIEAVEPASLRDEASVWLAQYAGEYTREVIERASAVGS